jgi:hypothetical protein
MPCHAMPMPHCAMTFRSHFQNSMVMAWHRHGMGCVNQTQVHCVNQMGKTQSKPLEAQHGRRTAWEQHGMCELAFKFPLIVTVNTVCNYNMNIQFSDNELGKTIILYSSKYGTQAKQIFSTGPVLYKSWLLYQQVYKLTFLL